MAKTSKTQSKETKLPDRLGLAYLLGFAGVVIFGATLPVTRLALVDFTPWFVTFVRAGLAAAMALVALMVFKRPLRHSNEIEIFIAGVLLIFAFPGMMALAMQTVPASHGGVILGFLPLATAVIANLIAGEKPSPKFWLLSILGAMIVFAYTMISSDIEGAAGFTIGDIWLVLAGLSAAFGYVLFGRLSRHTPGWEISSRALILNTPIIVIGIWWFYDASVLIASPSSIAAMIYLGAFSMYLGFCVWNAALAIGGIARIGQIQLLQTFITLLISALLLGEVLDLLTIATAIAITVIIAFSRKL